MLRSRRGSEFLLDSGFGIRENREDVFRGGGRLQELQSVAIENTGQSGEAVEMGTVVWCAKQEEERAAFTILRSEIDDIASSGKSLMPEGLEQKITPQDLSDLITYLKQN